MKNELSLYEQLAGKIKAMIESESLAVGDRIPSVVDLCQQFEVSHITVRSALKVLADEGIIESRRRQGIFVSDKHQKLTSPGSGREKTLGLLVPNGDHAFEAGIIRGVMEQCQTLGFHVLIANSNDHTEKEALQLCKLAEQVQGLIVFPAHDSQNHEIYLDLLRRSIPYVFVDRGLIGVSAPLVATDNEHGGYLATRHLLEHNYRDVYAITAMPVTSTQQRLNGFRRAIEERGVENASSFIRSSTLHIHEVGYTLTRELIAERQNANRNEPFGILALDEPVARSCYTAIKELGLKLPQDVAVVGYDDTAARFFDPPLSAIRQEPYRMGSSATLLLHDVLNRKKSSSQIILFKPELIIRASSSTEVPEMRSFALESAPIFTSPTRATL